MQTERDRSPAAAATAGQKDGLPHAYRHHHLVGESRQVEVLGHTLPIGVLTRCEPGRLALRLHQQTRSDIDSLLDSCIITSCFPTVAM